MLAETSASRNKNNNIRNNFHDQLGECNPSENGNVVNNMNIDKVEFFYQQEKYCQTYYPNIRNCRQHFS